MESLANLSKEFINNFKISTKVNTFKTGFTDLDYVMNIKNKGNLIVIGGRPAMGKTNLALNIAYNNAKNDVSVVWFSLDNSKEQIINRILCSEAMIDYSKVLKSNLNANEWEKAKKALRIMSNINLYIDDTPAISIEEIKEKCRKLKLENDIELIVIDYLQLLNTDIKNECKSRESQLSYISLCLKRLAKELDVNIIITTQLSRAPEYREDHRPIINDLLKSGAIVQDADEILFIYRDEYYNQDSEEKNIAEINIAKNRYGNNCTTHLLFIQEYCKYANMPDNNK